MNDLDHYISQTPAHSQWKKIGIKHHHGIALPLFSLHSRYSAGIGEYLDLIPLIKWCSDVGMDIIQLLPLNDTGTETSPYSALSAFALNPIHIRLADLPDATSTPALKKILYTLQHPKNEERVDYPTVQKLKREYFDLYIEQHGPEIAADPAFKAFCCDMLWLENYAIYKSIKEKHESKAWEEWPEDYRRYDPDKLSQWRKEFSKEILFHEILQYLCYTQLWEVKAAAERRGIYLKGDIPILINRDSADVWTHPHFFNLDWCAGAPADLYSSEGQNWGVPLYRWDTEEEGLFEWWKRRLHTAESLYHIYRIDHIVGFFRIWAMAPGQPGREGHFIPSEWTSWIPEGEKKLRSMLKATQMLPIGEDLGAVPPNVKNCLTRLGISGTKVLRWERDFDGDGHFYDPQQFSPLTLSTVSTHDSETLRQWWRDFPDQSQAYAKQRGWSWGMKITPEQQWQMLAESHHSSSLFHINLLAEYMDVFPDITWQAPEQNRVNLPGTVSDKNWTIRMVPSVEEIVEHKGLKAALKKTLAEVG